MSNSSVPRLKELRVQAELTQTELQKRIGVGAHTVCDWEKGKSEPNILNLMCLADIFDVTIDYIVGRSEMNKTESDRKEVNYLNERTK